MCTGHRYNAYLFLTTTGTRRCLLLKLCWLMGLGEGLVQAPIAKGAQVLLELLRIVLIPIFHSEIQSTHWKGFGDVIVFVCLLIVDFLNWKLQFLSLCINISEPETEGWTGGRFHKQGARRNHDNHGGIHVDEKALEWSEARVLEGVFFHILHDIIYLLWHKRKWFESDSRQPMQGAGSAKERVILSGQVGSLGVICFDGSKRGHLSRELICQLRYAYWY
jgi:hypothetical protein